MKTAIIGSKGFLGKHFSKVIPSAIEFHRGNVDDFTQINLLDDEVGWMWREKYDLIIHCAATNDSINQTILDANIIKWWKDTQPNATLVTFGTDACYPEGLDHSEFYYFGQIPVTKWSSYAAAKRSMLGLQTSVNRPSYHFVLSTLFGPNFKLNDEHLIHSLIKKIVKAKDHNLTVKIGNIGHLKECIYAPDVVSNVLKIVKNFDVPYAQVLNLGSPKKCQTLGNIASMICDKVGLPIRMIEYNDPELSSGPYAKWLNSEAAQKLIDYADTEWDESLQTTIDYYNGVK